MKVQRMCAVCRTVKNREELIRIAKTPEGLLVDERHKAGGRGAYICKCSDCILAARKRRTFERSFSCKVEPGLYDELERMVKDE
jgi:predicted RNA-binding protein YlxR (DUF448 family)